MAPAEDVTAPESGSEVVETHISWVFLTPDRAYKLMKPVQMPFFDHTSSAARVAAAERELELNRRIAPDVYLGLADVEEDGHLVDRMIVMRRLPRNRRLSELIDDPGFEDQLRAVARTVAAFHAARDAVRPAPMATRDAMRSNWEDNFAAISPHVGSLVSPAEFSRVEGLARAYLDGRSALFDARIRDGFVRDGHGDLIADDVFCLGDGPRIIDCLAFDDNWRIGDVLNDIAFLVMDVHRLAGPGPAAALLRWYQEFAAEHHPRSLAHHYTAYRSHVRAKVACFRHTQGDPNAAALAGTHHRLALHHLEEGRIRLIVVGGGPGAGKSTLAQGLADHFGVSVLATDEIRKDVTGTPRSEHRIAEPGSGIYDDATVDAVYAEQIRRAGILLEAGRGVVLDSSWTKDGHREAARALGAHHGAEVTEIECRVDPEVAKERVTRRLARSSDVSDATADVVDHLRSRRDPWSSSTGIDTGGDPAVALSAALDAMSVRDGLDPERDG